MLSSGGLFANRPYELGWASAAAIADDVGVFKIPASTLMPSAVELLRPVLPNIDICHHDIDLTGTLVERILTADDAVCSMFWSAADAKQFVAGVFHCTGSLSSDHVGCSSPATEAVQALAGTGGSLEVVARFKSPWRNLLRNVQRLCAEPSVLSDGIAGAPWTLEFRNINAVDFAGRMLMDRDMRAFPRVRDMIAEYAAWLLHDARMPVVRYRKTRPDAVEPTRHRVTDVGFDLTVVSVSKRLTSTCVLYDTGIALDIPYGFYVEIVPRSSLSKSGYMLANSVGVVDPSYTGSLLVALVKVDPQAPELSLPFRCCQVIVQKQTHPILLQADESERHQETSRAAGGFGSTGV